MAETDPMQSESVQNEGGQATAESAPGLGAILRSEREKKGMTLDQVASVTKLRRVIIEGMEKEAWANLPPPVFVRGFLRTYAKVLGLEEKNLLELYDRIAPMEIGELKPLGSPRRSRKGWFLFALVLAVILGFILYLWREYPSSWESQVQKKEGVPEESKKEEPAASKREAVKTGLGEDSAATQENMPSSETSAGSVHGKSLPGSSYTPGREEPSRPGTTESGAPREAASEAEERADAYVLKGVVVERTWIRISIDNGEPKEFLFSEGNRLQWKAKEGFDLIVGNAAGIELELNGKKLAKLGNLGQVVRMRLPEGFKPLRSED